MLKSKNDISGRLAIWAILCLNIIATVLYFFIPENEFQDHIFYFLVYTILIAGIFFISKISDFDIFTESGIKEKTKPVCYLYVVAISVGLLFFGSFFANLVYYGMSALGYTPQDVSMVIDTPVKLVLNLLTVSALPAFAEEMLVRGGIFTSLKNKTGIKKAIILSSLFFALLHGSIVQTVHQFIIGIACAVLLMTGGSIWYAIALHFCNNAIAVVLTYFEPMIYGDMTIELSTWQFFNLYNLVPQLLVAIVGLIGALAAFNAFIRNRERTKNIDYTPQPYSFSLVSSRIKRLVGEEFFIKKEKGSASEKFLFWIAVGATVLVILLDLFVGFVLL